MKKSITILASVFFGLALFAAPSKSEKKYTTYFVVGSKTPIEIISSPAGSKMLHRNWGPENERKNSVRGFCEISPDTWTNVKCKFKASDDDTIYINFGGESFKDKDTIKIAAYYDNVKVNGALIPNGDFEGDIRAWSLAMGNNRSAKLIRAAPEEGMGKYYLRATSIAAAKTHFKVKKNEIFELSFDAKALADIKGIDDDTPLDLSSFVNVSFVDETPGDNAGGWTDEGPAKSMKKFQTKVGAKEFEGVKFNIIDPDKNGGASVISLASSKFKTPLKTVRVDKFDKLLTGKFLYILHTSLTPPADKSAYMGGVIVDYEGALRRFNNITFGVDVGDCWTPGSYRNSKVVYLENEKKNTGAIYLTRVPLDNDRPIKSITFSSNGKIPWLILAASVSDKNVLTTTPVTYTGPEWIKADMPVDMVVKKGSALDHSDFFKDQIPSGKFGRVIVSERGTMAFENAPDKDVRFKGFTCYTRHFFDADNLETTKETARVFSDLVKRNGYNLIRLSFDNIKNEKNVADKAKRYDEINYFLAELKKNGVYVHMPLAWYDIGDKKYHFFKRNDVKIRAIMGEPVARALWKATAEEQLNMVNPYTGLAWKDDPVFQCFEYYNELSICINKRGEFSDATRKALKAKWVAWLQKKYGTIDKLNDVWAKQSWAKEMKFPLKSFDGVMLLTAGWDWSEFFHEMNYEFMDWCEKIVRATGYKGIMVQYNLDRTPKGNAIRNKVSESIIANSYYEHPTGIYEPGAPHAVGQESSIAKNAMYWLITATAKINDRPISVTEYNHAYWNKYRFEMASLFAPYSAYQNFSSLVLHASAVDWKENSKRALRAFNTRESPAIRSAQLLAHCFFMRGDITPAKKRIDLVYTKEFIDGKGAHFGMGGQQMRIPLITGFALQMDGDIPEMNKKVKVKPADLKVYPNGSSEIKTEDWFQEVVDSKNGNFNLGKFVQELKKKKILSEDNISDPENGIYQTDTGQITMDTKKLSLKVKTDKSISITVHNSEEVDLGELKLVSTTVPATVALCSIDDKKLSKSSRMVFVYATEENNYDAVTTADGVISFKEGEGPVVMRRGVVKAELKIDSSKKFSVYPIALSGERREKLDAEFKDGVLKLEIDNGKLKNGAVAMFEVVAQ